MAQEPPEPADETPSPAGGDLVPDDEIPPPPEWMEEYQQESFSAPLEAILYDKITSEILEKQLDHHDSERGRAHARHLVGLAMITLMAVGAFSIILLVIYRFGDSDRAFVEKIIELALAFVGGGGLGWGARTMFSGRAQ